MKNVLSTKTNNSILRIEMPGSFVLLWESGSKIGLGVFHRMNTIGVKIIDLLYSDRVTCQAVDVLVLGLGILWEQSVEKLRTRHRWVATGKWKATSIPPWRFEIRRIAEAVLLVFHHLSFAFLPSRQDRILPFRCSLKILFRWNDSETEWPGRLCRCFLLTSRSKSLRFLRNSTKRSQTVRTMFGGALMKLSASACSLSISSSNKRICRPE